MRGPFDFWERNGTLTYQHEDVRIYRVEGEDYLFVGNTLYASSTELDWYIKNVHPHARGKCLEIGLGLGIASQAILANKAVRHLLTVEKVPEVIEAFGKPLPRHMLLEADIYKWIDGWVWKKPTYDLIFVDHYTLDIEELQLMMELRDNLRPLLRPKGNMIFWIDENAPDEDQEAFKNLWILEA
jgi:spermidine synthase